MRTTPIEECRHWLGVDPGQEPDALIFTGQLDFPQAVSAWSAVLSDARTALWPNAVVGTFGDMRLAVAAGYGAALAGDITHICCTLGARVVIVIGYFGAVQPGIGYGDVLIPTRGRPLDSVAPEYMERPEAQTHASEELAEWFANRCASEQIPTHLGPVVSAPSIMTETDDHFREWHDQGYYGVDLEVGVTFAVAEHFGAQRGAMLVQSDSPIEGTYIFTRRSDEERSILRSRIYEIGRIALEAAATFTGEAKV